MTTIASSQSVCSGLQSIRNGGDDQRAEVLLETAAAANSSSTAWRWRCCPSARPTSAVRDPNPYRPLSFFESMILNSSWLVPRTNVLSRLRA